MDDRQRSMDVEWLRKCIDESLADPRPSIPAEEVFAKLRARHLRRLAQATPHPTQAPSTVSRME